MPRLLGPNLAILPVSLLGPGLWLIVQSTNVSNSYSLSNSYAVRMLEPALLYGVLPACADTLAGVAAGCPRNQVALASPLLLPPRAVMITIFGVATGAP